eukprot:TRINITY_DN32630_c0_g1_i2.p1 TRINITY_DN32630_c0_g1~~TRINITY_DN32630_c0_g1_i2.p1  ORF type:complete len:237 (+),score=66.65 TRINITY_DN32630_c0_g1_i2:97-807(+)
MSFYHIIHIIIAATSFIFSFYTICSVVSFLSFTPTQPASQQSDIYGHIYNLIILFMFTCQHSLMKVFPISTLLKCPSLSHLDRTWYVTGTNCCLMMMVNYWTSSSIILWNLDTTSSSFLWWLFSMTHSMAWYLIYCSTIMLDLPDLLGIRQIVQHCSHKTYSCDSSLTRLYSHMRHPSFSSLSIILLARPMMTLDRAIVATILCTYMYTAWRPDLADLSYQVKQWGNKKRLLDKLL